jgi:hypothetical protein
MRWTRMYSAWRRSSAHEASPMRLLQRVATGARALPLLAAMRRGQGQASSDDAHLRAAAGWLLQAQRAAGQGTDRGGYAHSFHLARGWQPAYPETTGYIIPSLHRAAIHFADDGPLADSLRASVAQAVSWLKRIQRPDGAIADLAGIPQVFDTGQVLLGFNYLAEHAPGLADMDALRQASRWLVAVQERDGSFVRHAYNGIPHSYYSRVGASLVAAGRIIGDKGVLDAGLANLAWTLRQQQAVGFFNHLSFDREPPFLHTMIYVVEGLLMGFAETGDEAYLDGARRFCAQLLDVSAGQVPFSQYNADFTPANRERCLTGVAQWAGVCLELAALRGDERYRAAAVQAIDYLKTRQIMATSDARLSGGLMGSDGPLGAYMRLAIPNWGIKFLIDALLARRRI